MYSIRETRPPRGPDWNMASSMMEVDETNVEDFSPEGSLVHDLGSLRRPVQNQGDEQDVDIHLPDDPFLGVHYKKQEHFHSVLEIWFWNFITLGFDKMPDFCYTFDQKKFSGQCFWSDHARGAGSGLRQKQAVFKRKDVQTGEVIVIKTVKSLRQMNPEELMVPLKLSYSENINKVLGFVFVNKEIQFISEDAGCPLSSQEAMNNIKSRTKYEPMLLTWIILQMFLPISEMHKKDIIHGNIKPKHICIDLLNMIVKLIGFGSCVTRSTTCDRRWPWTWKYLHPATHEQLLKCIRLGDNSSVLTKADDVLGLGLVVMYFLRGKHLMLEMCPIPPSLEEDKRKMFQLNQINKLGQPDLSAMVDKTEMPGPVKELLRNVLVIDDLSRRWTAQQAVDFLKRVLGSWQWNPAKFSQEQDVNVEDIALHDVESMDGQDQA